MQTCAVGELVDVLILYCKSSKCLI